LGQYILITWNTSSEISGVWLAIIDWAMEQPEQAATVCVIKTLQRRTWKQKLPKGDERIQTGWL